MIVTSMAAPAPPEAPQAGTGAGDPAASGETPVDDQPSFQSVLAHEEHTPGPPIGAGAATSGTPRSAKADEGKKAADGTAPLVATPVVATPAPILAALLAVATPRAALPAATKIADAAVGSPNGLPSAVGAATAGKTDPRPADLASGALEALMPGRANRTDQSDRIDQSRQQAGANQPVTDSSPHPAPGLAAAPHDAVLSRVAVARQSQAGAVTTANPLSRSEVQGAIPAMAGGTDRRGVGDRAASQGSDTLLHATAHAAPGTAKDAEAAIHALLTGGTAKTAGEEARNLSAMAGSSRTVAGVPAPLALLQDAGAQKPPLERSPSAPSPTQLTGRPPMNLDATKSNRTAVAAGATQTAIVPEKVAEQRHPDTPGDGHPGNASLTSTTGAADTSGHGGSRPTEAAAPRTSQPEAAGAVVPNQPAQASETQVQPSVVASQIPLSPRGSTQPQPPQAARQPGPTEPSGFSPRSAMPSQDHRASASAPSRGSDGSSVQSWANGAVTAPTTQHAAPVAAAARQAPAGQTGAVHQPIVQGILVRQASLQMVGAAASFKVVLHPRSLGEVTVQVTRVQEGLQVTIAPQQLTTQTLLNKHLPDLLGTLRTGQDLPVQAQVVAPHAPAPLGTPEAAAAGQSGLTFTANGGGQSFTGGHGGEQQQAWAGTMIDLLREPARTTLPAGPATGAMAGRLVGNPRIDVQA